MPEYTAESAGWARCGCWRRSATAGLADPLLPGRRSARCSARCVGDRRRPRRRPSTRAAPTPRPRCSRYYITRELPRGLRHVRLQRHPVQPRVAAARRDVRHAQDHPRRAAHQGRACRTSSTWATSTRSATGAIAGDYVEAMWLMLQQDEPDDYVIATGETHSVREFVEVGLRPSSASTGSDYVEIDPRYFRPTEVDVLLGRRHQGASEARAGSRRSTFEELVADDGRRRPGWRGRSIEACAPTSCG